MTIASRSRMAAGGRAATPVVYPVDLLTTPPSSVYSIRKVRSGYTGNCMRVTRNDGNQSDIGFDANGLLNIAALASFCAGTVGRVRYWFDQMATTASDTARAIGTGSAATQLRIYSGSATDTFGVNSRPCLRSEDDARGMVSLAFTAYTGSSACGMAVVALQSSATTNPPMFMTIAGSTAADAADNNGAVLIGRSGTLGSDWLLKRNAVSVTRAGTANTLQQITSVVGDPNYELAIDGASTTGATTPAAFNATKFGILHSGSAVRGQTDARIAEGWFWLTAPSSVDRSIVRDNQIAYFGTAA